MRKAAPTPPPRNSRASWGDRTYCQVVTTAPIAVPDAVRRRALAYGEAGARWLHELPSVVEELERRWCITVGSTFEGGTAACVAAATTADGAEAVVKIAMPATIDGDDAFERSVLAFGLARGRGCARLLAHDDELSALLIERLGRNLDELGLPVASQLEIICRTVEQMWVRVPPGTRLPSGAEKAEWLAEFIASSWEALDRPCSAAAIDMALGFAAARAAAFDPDTAVLVHGDAHSWNTLEAGNGTFKLVDPEGLISEPAHDLAVPMRELNEELLAGDALRLGRDRAQLLSRLTNVDMTAIWQWGFVERVSTGLYSLQTGQVGATEFLEIADRWAGTGSGA
jgi:streptomycin 6-kinase